MNITKHSAYEAIHNACQECEKLPASPQQTATVIAIGVIEQHVDKLVGQLEAIRSIVEAPTGYDAAAITGSGTL